MNPLAGVKERRILFGRWLSLIGLVFLLVYLAGCESVAPDRMTYDPVTGYPAVGDGHM